MNKITNKTKEDFMFLALKEAEKAFKKGDVPVGAIVVKDGKIVARAYNKKERKQNAIYHAEILAIDRACKKLKSFRLNDCELFVTLEPCSMCCGAILSARFKKVYFGAFDKNYGCCGSKYNFLTDKDFEHLIDCEGGILESVCKDILKKFFKEARIRNKEKKKALIL